MRMNLSFLAGGIALTLAGHALAYENKSLVIGFVASENKSTHIFEMPVADTALPNGYSIVETWNNRGSDDAIDGAGLGGTGKSDEEKGGRQGDTVFGDTDGSFANQLDDNMGDFGGSAGFFNCSITPAVPEPDAWILMLTGFGVITGASVLRRWKSRFRFA